MKLLLVEDVDKLGWLGDVVEVNEGYARNYLLPQGLAKPATQGNIRSIADEKAKRSEVRLVERKRLEQACAAVDGAEVVIASKANEQGHLFGSVTEKHIAENLRAQGFTVADEVVRLGEHIKEVGSYKVKLKFHAPIPTDTGTVAEELIAMVSVVVVAEGCEAEGTEQGSASEQAEQAPKQVGQTTEQEVDSGTMESQ
ncbi:MAG: 50S ribosomal protein L9 [Phycisphaerae bacterium]